MNKRTLIVSVVLLLFALYLNLFPFHEAVPLKKPFSVFPLHWSGWVGKDQFMDDVVLDKLKVSEYLSREYGKAPNRVGLYVGYYSAQREGAQIHSPKHCLPGGGWFKISEKTRSLDIANVGKINLVEAVYKKGDNQEVFIYWYKMKNAYITNDYKLKLYMILNSLRYRRNDAAFVRLSAPVSSNVEETISSMETFMKDFMPLLKDYLPE